jgi:uncharacterized membrane protein YccC
MSKLPDEVGWLRLAVGSACSASLASAMVTMPESVFPLWVRICGIVLGILIGCLVAAEITVWAMFAWRRRSERRSSRRRAA